MTAAEYIADYFDASESHAVSAPWGGRLGDLLVLLIPASAFAEIHLVGRLFAPDLLLLAMLPFVLASNLSALRQHLPKTFLALGIVWLAGQVATDLIRSTPFEDYSRGWAMIIVTLTNFTALYVLLAHDARRIVLYTLGSAAGKLLTYFLNPGTFAAAEPWKFGYGSAITLLIVLIASFANARSRSFGAIALMMFAAALNLYNGFRSLAGECFLTAAYLLLQRIAFLRRDRGGQITVAGALFAFATLALSSLAILQIYEYSASEGMLGYAAEHKYEIENSGRYGVLLGGRSEFLLGLEAALDSPLIGHGSWAKDWRYAARADTMMSGFGYQTSGPADSWDIPEHSHLVGAWVNAGILGAVFWLWILWLPAGVLGRLYNAYDALSPLIVFVAFVLAWDVMFSPYGAERRFITPYYVIVMMSFLSRHATASSSPVVTGGVLAASEAYR